MDTLDLVKLGEFTLKGKENVDEISVNPQVVSEACEELETYASKLDTLATALESQKEALVKEWQGEGAAALVSQFPRLMESFEQVSKCIRSLAGWAEESMQKKLELDRKTAQLYEEILGGAVK